MKYHLLVSLIILGITGCGSNDSNSPTPKIDLDLAPNDQINQNSSHNLQIPDIHIDPRNLTNSDLFLVGRVYGDFDGDGYTDVFISPSVLYGETKTPSEMYINNGHDEFELDSNFFPNGAPSAYSARKAITGDYNGDEKLDIFVVDHGIDKPPFPGAAPFLILSRLSGGMALGQDMSEFSGFQHGAASADIDADGDIDIFVANDVRSYFLINDGTGQFTKDTRRLTEFSNSPFYTVELLDIDEDGYVDLLIAGHEFEGFKSQILWGDSTGFYSSEKATVLPSVEGQGVVVDIDAADLNNDGHLDLVLNRTSDDTNGAWYIGYYLQLLERTGQRQYTDTSTSISDNSKNSGQWLDWIHLKDMNNDQHIDIVADNKANNLIWLNDDNGNGTFTK